MSSTGRSPALDDAKRQVVCALVARGSTLAEAAEYVGCDRSTLYRHRRRNEQFRQQLSAAKAQSLLAPYQVIRKAAGSKWRAAAWAIERIDSNRRRYAAAPPDEDLLDQDLDQPRPEEPSLYERLMTRPRTRGFLELTPEFEEAFPRTAAYVRQRRERLEAQKSSHT